MYVVTCQAAELFFLFVCFCFSPPLPFPVFSPGDEDPVGLHLCRLVILLIGFFSFPSQLACLNQGVSMCSTHQRPSLSPSALV